MQLLYISYLSFSLLLVTAFGAPVFRADSTTPRIKAQISANVQDYQVDTLNLITPQYIAQLEDKVLDILYSNGFSEKKPEPAEIIVRLLPYCVSPMQSLYYSAC